MKIKIISDIVLQPLLNEVGLINKNYFFDSDYCDNLYLGLKNQDIAELSDYQYIFIHTDCFFKKNDTDYILNTLKEIHAFAKVVKPYVIISNSFCYPFQTGATNKTIGFHTQLFYDFKQFIEPIVSLSNTVFFDFLNSLMEVGYKEAYNFNLGHLYQMPYTKKLIKKFAYDITQLLDFYSTPEKKAIIIDCDNTLWNGIVGETSIDELCCDISAVGVIHHQLQHFLKLKKEEGFLLCLCSKNNFADVQNVFSNKKMILLWDDFVIKKINWEPKHQNILEISKDLNLGLESLIFIDDSDFEIDAIRQILPEVSSIKIDNNYSSLIDLTNNYLFKKKKITNEDFEKTNQYLIEKEREYIKENSSSFDEYIKNLEIKLDVRKNDVPDFTRLSQLTEKTNQFNTNKIIYSEKELIDLVNNQKGIVYSLKVSDRFGDYGTVGMAIINFFEGTYCMSTLILSCRVLGRGIENDFFNYINDELKNNRIVLEEIKFNRTLKNKPAELFLNSIKNDNTYREIKIDF